MPRSLFAGRIAVRLAILPLALLSSTGDAAAQTPGWLIDPATGCRMWSRNMAGLDAVRWSGACVEGLADGKGTFAFLKDGKSLWTGEGRFVKGRREGRGTLVGPDGARFEYEYRAGDIDGYALEISPNGDRFEGEQHNGSHNGHGVYTWADGNRYDGDFKGGLPEGHGTFTFADGGVYDGEWHANLPHGQGTYRGKLDSGEKSTWSGAWSEGCLKAAKVALFRTPQECHFD